MRGFVGVLQDAMRGTNLVPPLGVGGNAQGPSPPSTAVHSMVSPSNRHQTTSQANGSTRSAVHVPNHWIAQPGKPWLKSMHVWSPWHHFFLIIGEREKLFFSKLFYGQQQPLVLADCFDPLAV